MRFECRIFYACKAEKLRVCGKKSLICKKNNNMRDGLSYSACSLLFIFEQMFHVWLNNFRNHFNKT